MSFAQTRTRLNLWRPTEPIAEIASETRRKKFPIQVILPALLRQLEATSLPARLPKTRRATLANGAPSRATTFVSMVSRPRLWSNTEPLVAQAVSQQTMPTARFLIRAIPPALLRQLVVTSLPARLPRTQRATLASGAPSRATTFVSMVSRPRLSRNTEHLATRNR